MKKKAKIINEGGVNGTDKGVININSKDYKGLRKAVQEHSKKQDKKERIRYKLISLRLQMDSYIQESSPNEVKSSGYFLKQFLKAIEIKNKEFANFIDIEESNLSAILNGKRKVNTELAFVLELLFNVNANTWLLIQNKNDLLKIQNKEGKKFSRYNLDSLLKKVG